MRLTTRGGLAIAAGGAAALIAAGAPLAAKGPPARHPGTPEHPGKLGRHPGTTPTAPSYGVKPPRPPKATFLTILLGKNEISANGRRRAGDLDAQGGATITITATGKLCFGIVVQGLDTPTLAHVHQGRSGVNGPIVVPLTPPSGGDPGASSGCVDVPDARLLASIQKHPTRFYVNVHTTAFPNGAMRGQLHRAPRD